MTTPQLPIQDNRVFFVDYVDAQGEVLAGSPPIFADSVSIAKDGTVGYWDIGTHRDRMNEFTKVTTGHGRSFYQFDCQAGVIMRFSCITKELYESRLHKLIGHERPEPLESDQKVQEFFKSLVQCG